MSMDRIRLLRRSVGLVWVALLVSLLCVVGISSLAPRLDRSVFIIRGASMTPTLPLGSLILVRPTSPDDLRVGDVVTIRGDNKVVYTHRIVWADKTEDGWHYKLQGDANESADGGIVPERAIVGRADLYAPYLGYILALLSIPSGMVSVMSILAALLLCYWLLEDLEHDEAAETVAGPIPTATPTAA